MHFSFLIFVLALVAPNAYSQDCSQPPPMVNPHDCCKAPKCPLMSDAVAEKCGLPKMQGGGPGSGPPPRPPCDAVICILKANNVLDAATNNVNQAAFQTFMENNYGSEWKSVIGSAVQKCGSDAASSGDGCPARVFVGCIKRQMMINCPSSLWSGTTECNNLKAHMQTCPPPSG